LGMSLDTETFEKESRSFVLIIPDLIKTSQLQP